MLPARSLCSIRCVLARPSASLWLSQARWIVAQKPATVIVDGQRSIELVRADLARSTAAHATRGVEVLAAGRQGVTIALRAAALLRPGPSCRQCRFTLAAASSEALLEAGLVPPAAPSAEDDDGRIRGFRMFFAPRSLRSEDAAEEPQETHAAPAEEHVLKVGRNTGLLPLAKAIATTVVRLPEGSTAAVETALKGKAKNGWTRSHLMAQAVAMAHRWQEFPSEGHSGRPFRCIASQFNVTMELKQQPSETMEASAPGTKTEVEVLRLSLLPTGPPTDS